jgi:Spy/CpxP family protein refolding chaperone
LFVFTLFFTCTVLAGNYKDKKLWWRNGQVVEELQLSPQQVKQIENIFQTYKGEIKTFNKNLNSKENQLKKLIQKSDTTREDVLKVTDEINTLKSDGQKLKVNMFWEIREVLTPKQRTQLQLIKERYMKGTPRNTIYFLDECLIKGHTFY